MHLQQKHLLMPTTSALPAEQATCAKVVWAHHVGGRVNQHAVDDQCIGRWLPLRLTSCCSICGCCEKTKQASG